MPLLPSTSKASLHLPLCKGAKLTYSQQSTYMALFAVPRSVREALTAWDRQLYDVPLMSEQPGPGILYERVYNLGKSLRALLNNVA